MPAKAFVIFFRYKLLLLAPFLVTIPLAIVYVLLSGSTVYQSTGKVRVDRPSFLASEATAGWNPYISMAANQSNFVSQRLKTNEFSNAVATTASEGYSREITGAEVRAGSWAGAIGENLLAIGYNGPDPEAARRIATATISEYEVVERAQTLAAAQVAIDIRQTTLDQRRDDLAAATKERDDYLASQPGLVNDRVRQELDGTLKRLNDSVTVAANQVRDAEADLVETQTYVDATLKGQRKTFAPIEADAPETPTAPLGRSKMDLLGPPILAFLAALSLSAVVYGFLFRTDRSLRSREDIVAVLPNVTFLGSVPDVGAPKKRAWPRDFVRVTATSGDDVEDALRRA